MEGCYTARNERNSDRGSSFNLNDFEEIIPSPLTLSALVLLLFRSA